MIHIVTLQLYLFVRILKLQKIFIFLICNNLLFNNLISSIENICSSYNRILQIILVCLFAFGRSAIESPESKSTTKLPLNSPSIEDNDKDLITSASDRSKCYCILLCKIYYNYYPYNNTIV